jgi:predicted  nucleic acid-binding Zn-ribbon protein
MPHQCTNCGRAFADGSKEMLSGCPDCGGNKFQFNPGGATTANAESAAPSGAADASGTGETGGSGRVSRARETVQDWVGTDTSDESANASAASSGTAGRSGASDEQSSPSPRSTQSHEDTAQADARTDVVSREELPDDPPEPAQNPPVAGEDAQVAASPDDDQPDLSELREELNDQFESIKIVNPGQYELNLMELYDRDEYIISLQEDGRYVIEVPETWRSDGA